MAVKTKLPTIEIGVSYEHTFKWSTRDEAGVVTPVDLTNWDGRLQLRKKAGDAVYLDLSTENTRLALSGNRIQIAIPSSVTKPLAQTSGEFDLVLWPRGDTDSAVRVAYGTFDAVKIITEIP